MDEESADTASDNPAEIKFGMRAAAPSSIATVSQAHPFFPHLSFFFALNSNFTMALSFIGYVLRTYLAYCR